MSAAESAQIISVNLSVRTILGVMGLCWFLVDSSFQHCVEVWDSTKEVADQKGGPEGVCQLKKYHISLSLLLKVYIELLKGMFGENGRGTTDQLFTLARIPERAC